jgi:hypothetical protein
MKTPAGKKPKSASSTRPGKKRRMNVNEREKKNRGRAPSPSRSTESAETDMKKFLRFLSVTAAAVLFAVFAGMAACPVWAAGDSEAEKIFTSVVEAKLREESPKNDLIFELESFERDGMCFTKTVTAKLGGEPVAVLRTEEYNGGEYAECVSREALELTVEDMNFDGFADIRIQAFLPAGPNVPYIVWLFNPKTNTYDHSPGLSGIPSFAVDSGNRWIRSEERDSAAVYTEFFYRYEDGELIMFREIEKDYEKKKTVTRDLKDGEMSVVSVEELE